MAKAWFKRIRNRLTLSKAKYRISYYQGEILLSFERSSGLYWGFLITMTPEELDTLINSLTKAREKMNKMEGK